MATSERPDHLMKTLQGRLRFLYETDAGGLAAIGVIAAIAVSVKEHEEEKAEQLAEKTDTEEVVSDATAQAMVQTPIARLARS